MNIRFSYRWFLLLPLLFLIPWLSKRSVSADQPLKPEIGDQLFRLDQLNAANWVEGESVGTLYTSDMLSAPFPFNALFSEWVFDGEEGAFELEIRTGTNGRWGKWQSIHQSHDWSLETEPFQSGELVLVPDADIHHTEYQFKLYFPDGTESKALLEELKFIFMDTTEGPTTAEMNKIQTVGKPPVIPRTEWCTYADCSCTTDCDPCIDENPLAYEPVTHLVIHHTVSANSSSNWAAVMRAIYSYHTYPTHCWGDVGYNYLIDMNGVIYEGHRGGDDVIGTHASAANRGSMGVALIGTFTSPAEYSVGIKPPQVMLDSLVDLVSWKVDQKGIDPFGASRMVHTVWGLPHIMGHRDVYGGTNTTCPGDQAHELIPWVRSQVANRIGFENPYRYFDSWYQGTGEDNSYFHKSDANWNVAPKGCGFNRHAYYTWSVTDPVEAVNYATWDLILNRAGNYEIEAYTPYCDINGPETDGAVYTINHDSGATEVMISQNDGAGMWRSLGTFRLDPVNSPSIYLTDLSPIDKNKGVWFDALRVRFLDPTLANVAPGTGWNSSPTVRFEWERENFVTDPLSMTIELARTSDFSPILMKIPVTDTATTGWDHTFAMGEAEPLLYWRIVAVISDTLAVVYSEETEIQFDLEPPSVTVGSVEQNEDHSAFLLSWEGQDSLSGVAFYDVDIRADNELSWSRWVTGSVVTETAVVPLVENQPYWFRIIATDLAGNVTPISVTESISSQVSLSPYIDLFGGSWYFSDTVALSWEARNMEGYQTQLIEIGLDPDFVSIILTDTVTGTDWFEYVPVTNETLYWRVSGSYEVSKTAVSEVGSFYIDTVGPDIQLHYFYQTMGGYFNELAWDGVDAGVGLSHYRFAWRLEGETEWQSWLPNGELGEASFESAGGVAQFQITAVDLGGNEQAIIVQEGSLFPNQALLPMMSNR